MATNVIEAIIQARDQITGQLNKANKSVSGFKVVAVNAFVEIAQKAAQAAKAIGEAANAGSKFADQIGDLSTKLNVSTEALSSLGFAASVTGSNLESVETGLRTLNRQALVAAQGSRSTAEIFARLGVTVTDTQGRLKNTEVLLGEIADGFQNLGSDTERAAAAQTIFGRSGADLIPILANGSERLDEFRARAEELGVVVGSRAAKAADLFQDTLADVRNAGLGLSIALGNTLLPAIQPAIAAFVGFVGALREFINEGNAAQRIGQLIGTGIQFALVFIVDAVTRFRQLATVIGGVGAAAIAFSTRQFNLIPGIVRETGKEMDQLSKEGDKVIDAMAKAQQTSLEFNKTQGDVASTNAETGQSFAAVAEQIEKARVTMIKAVQEQQAAESELAIGRAERSGMVVEQQRLELEGFLQKIQSEQEARIADLESQRLVAEQTILDREARDERIRIIDETLTATRKQAEAERAQAAEEAGARVVASVQETVAPITQAIEQVTAASIRGELSVAQAIKKVGETILKTVLNQAIDSAFAKLAGVKAAEIGKALIEAPGTFGASLAKIPLILAGFAAAKGLVSAIRLQEGGIVTGGTPGRDSVPALLEPGELVLPRRVTEFLQTALQQESGIQFQEGGVAGDGGGLVIENFTIENVSDVRYVDILIERINELVQFRGRNLVATRLAEA